MLLQKFEPFFDLYTFMDGTRIIRPKNSIETETFVELGRGICLQLYAWDWFLCGSGQGDHVPGL